MFIFFFFKYTGDLPKTYCSVLPEWRHWKSWVRELLRIVDSGIIYLFFNSFIIFNFLFVAPYWVLWKAKIYQSQRKFSTLYWPAMLDQGERHFFCQIRIKTLLFLKWPSRLCVSAPGTLRAPRTSYQWWRALGSNQAQTPTSHCLLPSLKEETWTVWKRLPVIS